MLVSGDGCSRFVFVPDDDGNGFVVVTVFDPTGKAPAAFRRRMGKRPTMKKRAANAGRQFPKGWDA